MALNATDLLAAPSKFKAFMFKALVDISTWTSDKHLRQQVEMSSLICTPVHPPNPTPHHFLCSFIYLTNMFSAYVMG